MNDINSFNNRQGILSYINKKNYQIPLIVFLILYVNILVTELECEFKSCYC